jgi:hypothetical protein
VCDARRHPQAIARALDHRRQRGQRALRACRDHLHRRDTPGEALRENVATQRDEPIERTRRQRNHECDERRVVQQQARGAQSRLATEPERECEDTDGRNDQHPVHDHDHRFGHGREETGEHVALRGGKPRCRKTEECREHDQREDCVVGRRRDDVRWQQPFQKTCPVQGDARCRAAVCGALHESSGHLRIDRPRQQQGVRKQHREHAGEQ